MLKTLLKGDRAPSTLCVMAHADDETIIAGGLLARIARLGARVKVVILCGRDQVRRTELAEACRILGAEHEILDYMDGTLTPQMEPEILKTVVARIRSDKPELVVTHDPEFDYNKDHLMLGEWVRFACQKAGMSDQGHRPDLVISGEVHIPIPFPDYIVDISEDMDRMLEALRAHKSQLEAGHKQGYYTRLLEQRCRWRGAQAGCDGAMAFRRLPLPVIGDLYKKSPLI
ncbi:MAG: PIG-L deacetylase family protein [Candidatus Sumerlaeia bacterium]